MHGFPSLQLGGGPGAGALQGPAATLNGDDILGREDSIHLAPNCRINAGNSALVAAPSPLMSACFGGDVRKSASINPGRSAAVTLPSPFRSPRMNSGVGVADGSGGGVAAVSVGVIVGVRVAVSAGSGDADSIGVAL